MRAIFKDWLLYINEKQEIMQKSQKRNFDFVVDVPPLPDSFFDPLPDEEIDLWSL